MQIQENPVNASLFIDFDNVFIGLQSIDPRAAERFATDPLGWMQWITEGFPSSEGASAGDESSGVQARGRRILVRKCYLNPLPFGKYRPYFTRAAVNAVDCPTLTFGGKTSADIYMAVDILDTLQHRPHVEEFIILSADADFTPLLLRLREFGKRSIGLAAGPAAAAYRNAFDVMLLLEDFIEKGLDLPYEGGPSTAPTLVTTSPERLKGIADATIREAITRPGNSIPANELPGVYRRSSQFTRDSNWLGYYSLRALTEAVVGQHSGLNILEGDPWMVQVDENTEVPAGLETGPSRYGEPIDAPLVAEIVAAVKETVASSSQRIPLATVATQVVRRLGDRALSWGGHASFSTLLHRSDLDGLRIETAVPPGYIYDPSRHSLPVPERRPDRFSEYPEQLRELAQRVHNITEAPLLNPAEYAACFRALSDILETEPFYLSHTSRQVRDRCLEGEFAIPRQSVNFIMRGLESAGLDYKRYPARTAPEAFAERFRDNVLNLLSFAQVDLNEDDSQHLDDWIRGGFGTLPGG